MYFKIITEGIVPHFSRQNKVGHTKTRLYDRWHGKTSFLGYCNRIFLVV